jgi:flagellar hook assembly protein FlgD
LAGNIATGIPRRRGPGSYSKLNLWEGGYTVTPSAAGFAFVPASQFVSLQATNTAVNFVGGPVSADATDNLFDPSKGETMAVNYSVLPGPVLVRVYTLRGVPVKTLVDGAHAAGAFSTTWDGRNDAGEIVASGIYLIRIEADRLNEILKAAVVK